MARFWQFQEVQNYLSDIVTEAIKHGPQIITQEKAGAIVVLSFAEYYRLR